MQPTFIVNSESRLVSAIRPKDMGHTITAGSTLVFVRPYLTPHGLVPSGTKGTVARVDDRDGSFWLQLSGFSLPAWGDMLLFSPYETEDMTACVARRVKAPARTVLVAAMAVAALLFGLTFDVPALESFPVADWIEAWTP